jgi:hypothetical protein
MEIYCQNIEALPPPIAPWMTIDNEKYIGMTLHYINKGCDTGNDIYQ